MPDGDKVDVPADDPPTFPEADAQVVYENAAYLDYIGVAVGILAPAVGGTQIVTGHSFAEAVEGLLDAIIDLLGNYQAVRHLALDWANYANVPMEIRSSMRDQLAVANIYWEGGCFTAFSEHMNNIFEGLYGTHRKMTSIAKVVAGMITLIFNTYASALGFITECVNSMSAIVADWPVALKGFADALVKLMEESLITAGGYEEKLVQIDIDAITFPGLSEDSATMKEIADPEDWEVQKAPGT